MIKHRQLEKNKEQNEHLASECACTICTSAINTPTDSTRGASNKFIGRRLSSEAEIASLTVRTCWSRHGPYVLALGEARHPRTHQPCQDSRPPRAKSNKTPVAIATTRLAPSWPTPAAPQNRLPASHCQPLAGPLLRQYRRCGARSFREKKKQALLKSNIKKPTTSDFATTGKTASPPRP